VIYSLLVGVIVGCTLLSLMLGGVDGASLDSLCVLYVNSAGIDVHVEAAATVSALACGQALCMSPQARRPGPRVELLVVTTDEDVGSEPRWMGQNNHAYPAPVAVL
jgi:hypothetical protein